MNILTVQKKPLASHFNCKMLRKMPYDEVIETIGHLRSEIFFDIYSNRIRLRKSLNQISHKIKSTSMNDKSEHTLNFLCSIIMRRDLINYNQNNIWTSLPLEISLKILTCLNGSELEFKHKGYYQLESLFGQESSFWVESILPMWLNCIKPSIGFLPINIFKDSLYKITLFNLQAINFASYNLNDIDLGFFAASQNLRVLNF